jgi:hypothetical protein
MASLILGTCLVLFIIFHRPILAIIAILTGDKEALRDCNFCEDKVPSTNWTYKELRKPGDPEPKWRKGEDTH